MDVEIFGCLKTYTKLKKNKNNQGQKKKIKKDWLGKIKKNNNWRTWIFKKINQDYGEQCH